jgi:hypothetical protein
MCTVLAISSHTCIVALLCFLVGEIFLHCWCAHINWHQRLALWPLDLVTSRVSVVTLTRSNTTRLLTIKALALASLKGSGSYPLLDLLSSTNFKYVELHTWSNRNPLTWYRDHFSVRVRHHLSTISTLKSNAISFLVHYGLFS